MDVIISSCTMGPQFFYSLFEMIPEIKTDLKDKWRFPSSVIFSPSKSIFWSKFLIPKCVDRDRNRFLYGVGTKFEFTEDEFTIWIKVSEILSICCCCVDYFECRHSRWLSTSSNYTHRIHLALWLQYLAESKGERSGKRCWWTINSICKCCTLYYERIWKRDWTWKKRENNFEGKMKEPRP